MSSPVILYVEDEESDVLLLRLACEMAEVKFKLMSVCDGETARAYLKGNGQFAKRDCYPLPSLVLLDLNLPRESGFDVLAWIRSQPQFSDLPIIVYTSSLNADDCAKARRLRANDYVVKLSDLRGIAGFVRSLLDRLKPGNLLRQG